MQTSSKQTAIRLDNKISAVQELQADNIRPDFGYPISPEFPESGVNKPERNITRTRKQSENFSFVYFFVPSSCRFRFSTNSFANLIT